jgi:hypothetical protein
MSLATRCRSPPGVADRPTLDMCPPLFADTVRRGRHAPLRSTQTLAGQP